MKHEIPFRIIVRDPLPGVVMQVQRGRDELLPPKLSPDGTLIFDFELSIQIESATPNFLGKYAEGPKDSRFVYVNSGTYADQEKTFWSRRAKLSLMSITAEQIERALSAKGSRIETTMNGVGKDGGPTCASVKGIEWKVVTK